MPSKSITMVYDVNDISPRGFTMVPDEIASRKDLTWPEKAVYGYLIRCGKRARKRPPIEELDLTKPTQPQVFPGLRAIARDLAIARNTVQRAIRKLEDVGLIYRYPTNGYTNRYALIYWPWMGDIQRAEMERGATRLSQRGGHEIEPEGGPRDGIGGATRLDGGGHEMGCNESREENAGARHKEVPPARAVANAPLAVGRGREVKQAPLGIAPLPQQVATETSPKPSPLGWAPLPSHNQNETTAAPAKPSKPSLSPEEQRERDRELAIKMQQEQEALLDKRLKRYQ